MTSVVANLLEGPPIENSLWPRKWKFASGCAPVNSSTVLATHAALISTKPLTLHDKAVTRWN